MRRSVTVDPNEVLASVLADGNDTDETVAKILDAASELYISAGVRRVSIEDIAERSGVGRTTIYRRFDSRQQILEAVLGRDIRRFFASIIAPSTHLQTFGDVVVASFVNGLAASEASLLATVVRAEPELLKLLTIDGGPLIDAGRTFIVALYAGVNPGSDTTNVELVAELLIRVAISLILTPTATFPIHDAAATSELMHRLLDPVLETLIAPA